MFTTRREAIQNFLRNFAPDQSKDLAALYTPEMEVQVNVAKDNGDPIEGEYKGKRWKAYTDGMHTWKHIRIPYDAKTQPHYEDRPMTFNLADHVEGIGMTGWDWVKRQSRWVAFDFDAIIGHADAHAKKLTDEQLQAVKDAASRVPWVTVRKSTSGKGLHLYVMLPNVPTENHNEHAALARAILSKLSNEADFDFEANVDAFGGNMWVYHRKQRGTHGLALIKKGIVLQDIPANWRDYLKAEKKKSLPKQLEGYTTEEDFEALCGQYPRATLDDQHKRLIAWLTEHGHAADYDPSTGILTAHTAALKPAHIALGLKGIFETVATGKTQGDRNCFGFALPKGAWVIRRFGQSVQEHSLWKNDPTGWTRCRFNVESDFKTAVTFFEGVEDARGHFVFQNNAGNAVKAAAAIGIEISIADEMKMRTGALWQKGNKTFISIEALKDEKTPSGWLLVKNDWQRVYETPLHAQDGANVQDVDHVIRHVVTADGEDAGLYVCTKGSWIREPLANVKPFLQDKALPASYLGTAINNPWWIVSQPFKSEYPGDRQWNKRAVRFKVKPSGKNIEELTFPAWKKVLNNCGQSANSVIQQNEWCAANGVTSGLDYLALWIALMLRCPEKQLPYLFLFGDQDSGKSTLFEAISLLITENGVVEGNNALRSSQGFNAELVGAILCYIEEVDLSSKKSDAYSRIKVYVTSLMITIHPKFGKPYSMPNTLHFIQTANDRGFCPVFEDDTRILVLKVPKLQDTDRIPKEELRVRLKAEAPDFLQYLLLLKLPMPCGRLTLPVIETSDKIEAQRMNRNELQDFFADNYVHAPGALIRFTKLFDEFIKWLPDELKNSWSKRKFSKSISDPFVRGTQHSDNNVYIGNIDLKERTAPNGKPWVVDKDGYLYQVK